MSESNILTALRDKLRPAAEVVAPMPKKLSPETLRDALMTKRSGAEARLADATKTYQRAALDVEKGVPGAAGRKAEAAAALREAEENIRDVMGAQIEVEAEWLEAERRERSVREAAEDAVVLASCTTLATKTKALQEAFTTVMSVWPEAVAAYAAFSGEVENNPRVKAKFFDNLNWWAKLEMGRVAPKVDNLGLFLPLPDMQAFSVPNGELSLVEKIESSIKAVKADLEKAAAKRGKNGARK